MEEEVIKKGLRIKNQQRCLFGRGSCNVLQNLFMFRKHTDGEVRSDVQ